MCISPLKSFLGRKVKKRSPTDGANLPQYFRNANTRCLAVHIFASSAAPNWPRILCSRALGIHSRALLVPPAPVLGSQKAFGGIGVGGCSGGGRLHWRTGGGGGGARSLQMGATLPSRRGANSARRPQNAAGPILRRPHPLMAWLRRDFPEVRRSRPWPGRRRWHARSTVDKA